jgi:hypothetical protein
MSMTAGRLAPWLAVGGVLVATPALAQTRAPDTDEAAAEPADDDTADGRAAAPVPKPAPRAPSAADDPRASADGIFFGDKLDDEDSIDGTLWQGSLTGTSFVYTESADPSDPSGGGAVPIDQASPASRYFSDLRAQLDGKHLFGGRWDLKLDFRGRVAPGKDPQPTANSGDILTGTQSGTFGGNEYDLRELYFVRGGESSDLFIGRQQVLELAAIKIDGARFVYSLGRRWNVFALGGLYPTRSSRSLDSDYPDGVDAMGASTGPVLPVAAGGGASYRTQVAYGSIGAGGILPLGDDIVAGEAEKPRVFVTAQGYTRLGQRLDAYHYLVVDFAGADGFAVTNGSLGLDWNPHPRLHVTGAFHRVDTETLNVQAQTLLEEPTPVMQNVQNNVEVLRIASDAARLGVSAALGAQQRFELSVQAALRRRGDIALTDGQGATVVIPAAQGGELLFQAVDRRSVLGLRLSGTVGRFFPIGDVDYFKSETLLARLAVSREFAGGRGEWELEAGYQYTQDADRTKVCTGQSPLDCYGTSKVAVPQGGGMVSYRFATDWFGLVSAWVNQQTLTITDGAAERTEPAILGLTGMARVGFRF